MIVLVKKDIVGKRFGRLVVTQEYKIKNKRAYWLCVCDCGNSTYIYRQSLIKEKTQSCGCIVKRHGESNSRIYAIYNNMIYRCNTPTSPAYDNYGGRGISVCEEWMDKESGFVNFYQWAMQNGYNDTLTIDRIDSNDGYKPYNCRWVTKSKNTAYANQSKQHRKADKGLYFGISPNGEYYEFENASQFSKKHTLNANLVRSAANKTKYKTSKYQGWEFGFVCERQ